MSELRQAIERARAAASGREERDRAGIAVAARAVVDQWEAHPGRAGDGSLSVSTPSGQVHIGRMELGEVEGHPVVEVFLAGVSAEEDPHYRLWNPPVQARQGRELVEDPVLAVAQVVGQVRGSVRARGAGRRGARK
jgi:hypothetical protein